MGNSTWKAAERRIAKLFGTNRIPIDGSKNQPDIQTDSHTVQVKHWAKIPKQVENALVQAELGNSGGRLPLAIIGGKNRRTDDALVVMRLSDYIEWYSPLGEGNEQEHI